MSKPLRTEEEAEDELSEAIRHYEERRAGLGEDLLAAVDKALARIVKLPGSGAPVPHVPSELRVRRMPVEGFPYRVIYPGNARGPSRPGLRTHPATPWLLAAALEVPAVA